MVGDGDQVAPGTVLGLEGSTGFSTGPHLHFEVDRGCPAVGCSIDPAGLVTLPPGPDVRGAGTRGLGELLQLTEREVAVSGTSPGMAL